MRKKTKIKIPGYIKQQDYKLYVAFCIEHIKETDTPDDIERMWKAFKKSLKNTAKEIIKRTKDLQ